MSATQCFTQLRHHGLRTRPSTPMLPSNSGPWISYIGHSKSYIVKPRGRSKSTFYPAGFKPSASLFLRPWMQLAEG